MGLHETKKLLHSKGNHQKRQPTEQEKIFASCTSDRVLNQNIQGAQLNSQEINNPIIGQIN
jgi:hypothetical protein